MAAVASATQGASQPFGAGRRLLIVDDEETVRTVLKLILKPTGFELQTAEDVGSAVRALDTSAFDVVVTDKNLPDGSGLDVIRAMKERRIEAGIVMVTGYGSHESAIEALRLGVSHYLSKPFADLAAVRSCVRASFEASVERRLAADLARNATPPASDAERRLRFPVEIKVRFVLVDGAVSQPTLCSSLSMVDLFVETPAVILPGVRVTMRIDLPDGILEVDGVVRRAGEGRRMRGLRIEFVEADDSAETALAAFLEPARAKLREPAAPSMTDDVETVASELTALADAGAGAPGPALSPDIDAIVQRWAALEALPPSAVPPEAPSETEKPEARFELDAFALFRSMLPEQARLASLMSESAGPKALEPAVPATPLEDVKATMLDARSIDGVPDSTGVEEQGRFDVGELQKKYGLDESLFDELEVEVEVEVPTTVSAATRPVPSPPWESSNATNPEQRRSFAQELRRRAEASIAAGLLVKAASDLALAVVFDPSDAGLKKLHDETKLKSNEARAEEMFLQGMQQLALGDQDSAAKLLLSACKARFELRFVTACAKVLLRIADPDSIREARKLLRAALEKEPGSATLHVLMGGVAESEGLPKVAVRLYRKALALEPENVVAAERCEALAEKR